MKGALEGIRILDLSRMLPFEYCTMILADLGADVLKIEEPKIGDYMRWIPPKLKEENAIFLLLNRNKRSMTLNLRKEAAKEILKRLAAEADVLFESFRPGVMERLGLGYEELSKVNPNLIYCSSTGYGQTGPYRNEPGHDINYISIAGILERTGLKEPVIPGIPVADMTIGVYSALAILAALLARDRIGKGQYIDMSMTDCMLSYNIANIGDYIAGKREKAELRGEAPYYNVYQTKDGKWLSIGNIEDKFWAEMCEGMGRADLIERHSFGLSDEEKEELKRELQEVFKQKTRDEWLEIFKDKDTCVTPVQTVEEALNDPNFIERGMFFEIDHPKEGRIKQIALPIKFSETPCDRRSPPPLLGEHTAEVLKGLGYDEAQIEELKREGVI
ncbi:CoA transferase [Methanosarcinales archaeon]|nr:MAG: CoA transferase [Candidatus Syntrophoarchaeum sp. WYZ-LMO15]RLG30544.1 MAG: CoA transferase [Methanosarcinales archaeon]